MIDFDVESTGLQPWSQKQHAFLYIFGDDEGTTVAYPHTEREKIQAWFDRAKGEGIRAWNSKFDRAFAEAGGFDIPGDGMWHDAMIVAQAFDERRSVALKAVARELYGEDADDDQKKVKAYLTKERARRKKEAAEAGTELVEPNYSDVPMEIMEPYALEDVVLTRKIADHYDTLLPNTDLGRVIEFERKAMDALYAIEKRGLPARPIEYRKLEQEVIENLEVLEAKVQSLAAKGDPVIYAQALAGENWGEDGQFVEVDESGKVTNFRGGAMDIRDFSPKSSAQIIAALKARGADLSLVEKGKSGALSADAENLRTVDDALAAAILDFRSEFKVLSTYVQPMIGRSYETSMRHWKEPFIAPDNRIHANYRQVGARTGRMSCSDPNMQNQPRDDLRLRYNIVADPGYKLVACDLSNVEMVLFAAYAGPGRLLDTIRAGGDLHALTAKALGIRDRRRPGGGIETARQLGKTYNFSRVYGGGLRTIMRQFRCTREEAKLYKRRFDDAYPEVSRLMARVEAKMWTDGYVQDKLISGRHFRGDPAKDSYKMVNYLVQGTAASLLKYAVVNLHQDGIPMVALVHDEIVAHVPEGDAAEAAKLIEQRMTEHPGVNEVVPLRAEADIVDRWSQAKDPEFVPRWSA